jgi:hypothetical protein
MPFYLSGKATVSKTVSSLGERRFKSCLGRKFLSLNSGFTKIYINALKAKKYIINAYFIKVSHL